MCRWSWGKSPSGRARAERDRHQKPPAHRGERRRNFIDRAPRALGDEETEPWRRITVEIALISVMPRFSME
jgi:hypothetical protein